MSTAALNTSGSGAVRAAAAGATAVAAAGAASPGESRGEGPEGASSPENLTKLKVSELKALYRQGGGKPGALRKAELVERLTRSLDEGRGSSEPRPSETAASPAPAPVEAHTARTVLEVEAATPPAVDAEAAPFPVSSSPQGAEEAEGQEGHQGFFVDSDLLAPHTVEGTGVVAEAGGVVVGEIDHFTSLVAKREEEERAPLTPFGADGGGGDGGGGRGGGNLSVGDPSESVAVASGGRHATRPGVAFSESLSSDARGAVAGAGAGAGAAAAAAADGVTVDASTFGAREEGPPVARYGSDREGVAGDVLSSGPSAVVAAARARGAAAAAASARVAAGGRSRAMAEVRRHTDAVRSKAANGWSQSAEGLEQEKQRQGGGGMWPAKGSALVGVPLQGGGERNGAGTGAGAGSGVGVGVGAAAQARGGVRSATIPIPGYGDVPRQPAHMMMGSAPRGRRAGGQGEGGGGREADHQVGAGKAGRADGHGPGPRRDLGRPRLMPPMPNPWSRGGAGGAAEGLPEEGDVVDAFLEDVMMQSSDSKEREPSGDAVFDR